jgi:hypothetical protein
MDSINPTTPEVNIGTSSQEMSMQEMLFIMTSYFYIVASELSQQALEVKNEALVVIKKEDDPEVAKDLEATKEYIAGVDKEEQSLSLAPEDSITDVK